MEVHSNNQAHRFLNVNGDAQQIISNMKSFDL